jgi:hypothetical protein
MFNYNEGDLMGSIIRMAIERQVDTIIPGFIFIVVHNDKDQIETLKKIEKKSADSIQKSFIF